jgi:hypothetical protein
MRARGRRRIGLAATAHAWCQSTLRCGDGWREVMVPEDPDQRSTSRSYLRVVRAVSGTTVQTSPQTRCRRFDTRSRLVHWSTERWSSHSDGSLFAFRFQLRHTIPNHPGSATSPASVGGRWRSAAGTWPCSDPGSFSTDEPSRARTRYLSRVAKISNCCPEGSPA